MKNKFKEISYQLIIITGDLYSASMSSCACYSVLPLIQLPIQLSIEDVKRSPLDRGLDHQRAAARPRCVLCLSVSLFGFGGGLYARLRDKVPLRFELYEELCEGRYKRVFSSRTRSRGGGEVLAAAQGVRPAGARVEPELVGAGPRRVRRRAAHAHHELGRAQGEERAGPSAGRA